MEEKITMADIVIRIIRENQLAPEDENRIRELLEERKQEWMKNGAADALQNTWKCRRV